MKKAGRIFSFLLAAAICLSLWAVPSAAYMEYEPVYAAGDVNHDSAITATDALIALQTAVGKTTLGYDEADAADVDGNWTVNATDALMILQGSVGKLELSAPKSVYDRYEYTYVAPTGLEKNTTYMIWTRALTGSGIRKDFDTLRLMSSIQGLINRNTDKHKTAVALRYDVDIDIFWYNFISEEGATFHDYAVVDIKNITDLISTFLPFMKEHGIVAWDPSVPATSNVAGTICGLDGYLPVMYSTDENSLYYKLTVENKIPVRQSLVGVFGEAEKGGKIKGTNLPSTGSPKNDAYRWALDRYMSRCNPELLAYTPDAASLIESNPVYNVPDGKSSGLAGVPNHDYFVAKQCFFFDVTSYAGEPATDEPDQPLGADAETCKAVLEARYKMAGSAFGTVVGFPPWHIKYTDFVPGGSQSPPRLEWHFVELCVSYNCGIEADAAQPNRMTNASLYTKYEMRYEAKANKAADETITFDPDTYYICQTYAGDFDCSPWLKAAVPTVWTDENLHNVTMCFNYSPSLIDRMPAAFDFVRSVRSDKQYFTAGEGTAYVMTSALFEGFEGKEFNPSYSYATLFKGSGTESVVHRTNPSGDRQYIHYIKPYMNGQKLDLFGRMIDGFSNIDSRDMTLLNYLAPNGTLLHSRENDVRIYNSVPFIHVGGFSGNTDAERAQSLYVMLRKQKTKFFAYGYFDINSNRGTPSGYKAFMEEFENYMSTKSTKVKSVDIETFFKLLSESGRGDIVG